MEKSWKNLRISLTHLNSNDWIIYYYCFRYTSRLRDFSFFTTLKIVIVNHDINILTSLSIYKIIFGQDDLKL